MITASCGFLKDTFFGGVGFVSTSLRGFVSCNLKTRKICLSHFAFTLALHRVLIFFLILNQSYLVLFSTIGQFSPSFLSFQLSVQDQDHFRFLPSRLCSIKSQFQSGAFTSLHFDSLRPLMLQLPANWMIIAARQTGLILAKMASRLRKL